MAKSIGKSGGKPAAKIAASGKTVAKDPASAKSRRVIRESSAAHRDALKRLADR